MNKRFTEEELKQIAAQLRKPHGEWGIEVGENMAVKNAPMIQQTLETAYFNKGDSILEIGFGNGAHVSAILANTPQSTYTGIDISELMVKEARLKNKHWIDRDRADFQQTNGVSIPFEENRFDVVFSVNTIYFWEQPEQYIIEISRVLKKGGRLLLTFGEKVFMENLPMVNFGFRVYEKDEAEALFLQAGLSQIQTHHKLDITDSPFGDKLERNFIIMTGVKPAG